MNNLVNKNNYEHTNLGDVNFPFQIFRITQITPPHWHEHTELIYVLKGSTSIYINGNRFKCEEGEIAYIPNSSLHTIVPDEPSEYYALVIGDTLFNNINLDVHFKEFIYPFLHGNLFMPFVILKSYEKHYKLKFIIDEIIEEAVKKNNGYESVIKSSICNFFAYILRFIDCRKMSFDYIKSENIKNIKRVFDFIDRSYMEKITISDMAKLTNFSPQHFCRIFKSYTGKTFVEYLTLIRLEKAKDLITKTDMPITQVAVMSGFCNANYFDRVFKKYYDCQPFYMRKRDFTEKP